MDISSPTKVLFVCLGNICRSPMAEAVFTHMVNERQLADFFHIDSAGTAGYHVGNRPDSRSVATCKAHGVPVNHFARQVCPGDYEEFDFILCMDKSNLEDLMDMRPKGSKAVVSLFGAYDELKPNSIIEDPYYGGNKGFEVNFEQVTRCSEGLLKSLGF
ncbi:phosphotyrosine protein phosphatase I superfamily [Kickxella alabastrina]|uniref:phosphotyrosine protein phosphatase I superfamily n=1 Tax=Kickxella alabastrina TaxID=61397 RepID=UPI00221E680F|nr:phosphotyrosine protein phosphatase I superfamily [Kickxella alabastrina]KAI7827759.1 phosphotyrosine protein phosphatase I superfamily [Kickxella alabastrina]